MSSQLGTSYSVRKRSSTYQRKNSHVCDLSVALYTTNSIMILLGVPCNAVLRNTALDTRVPVLLQS